MSFLFLSGRFGSLINDYYGLNEKNRCKVVAADKFGELLPFNNSYNGVLKLLNEKKADISIDAETYFFAENFLSYSTTIMYNTVSYGQIKFDLDKRRDLNFLSLFDIERYLIYLSILSFIFIFLLLFKFINLKQLADKTCLILTNLFATNFKLTKKLNVVAFLVIFYNLYFMLFKILVTLDMKSNILVLNTSSIVDNSNDLLRTNYLICWLKEAREHVSILDLK